MQTMFDIGDEIEFTVRAKVKRYDISKDGDCYCVELCDKLAGEGAVLYIDTNMLKACHARKIEKDISDFADPLRNEGY